MKQIKAKEQTRDIKVWSFGLSTTTVNSEAKNSERKTERVGARLTETRVPLPTNRRRHKLRSEKKRGVIADILLSMSLLFSTGTIEKAENLRSCTGDSLGARM